MMILELLLIGLFLPLFPLSTGFNFLLERVEQPLFKSVFLLLWPLTGIALSVLLTIQPPSWVLGWAAFTAVLYGYRLISQRDVNVWIGFLATSIWSLFWILLLPPEPDGTLLVTALLGFSVPLILLVFLASQLKQRFGVAFTHFYGGLANSMPRFAGLLVFSMLAATATPLFPGFFIMLKLLIGSTLVASPAIVITVLLTWLLWSWGGIRVMQGLLVGVADKRIMHEDLSRGLTWVLIVILAVLVVAGLFITGGMS